MNNKNLKFWGTTAIVIADIFAIMFNNIFYFGNRLYERVPTSFNFTHIILFVCNFMLLGIVLYSIYVPPKEGN